MNKFPWKFSNRASRLTWQLKMFACDIKFICIQLLKTVRGGGRERKEKWTFVVWSQNVLFDRQWTLPFRGFYGSMPILLFGQHSSFQKNGLDQQASSFCKKKIFFFCRSIVTQICLKSVHPDRLFAI